MAGGGAKKRAEENNRTIKLIGIYILVCTAFHATLRLWLKSSSLTWAHWAGFAATLAAHAISYLSIIAVARPVYQGGTLVDGGADLSKGMISYYFDLLYVTGFVQVLTAFTTWGWYLYLVVPTFGVYVIATKLAPLIAGGKDEEVEIDEATRKRLEKTERRAERRRVKRI